MKFLGLMRLKKLVYISNHDHINEGNFVKKILVFAQLIQCFDDRSLSGNEILKTMAEKA